MTELHALMFEVVRRGYDIDEVNAHLATIERQRGAELNRAQAVIQQKDAEIDRLHDLTAEVEEVGHRRAEVDRMTVEAARKRESMLEEASRAAREQTTLASKTAAGLRADTEKEMSALRRDTEAEMSELRSATHHEAEAKLDAARAEARRIELDAQENAQRLETETLQRLAEFEAGQELQLQHRRSQADRDHSATLRAHRQTEEQLAAQVVRLHEIRESLVGTMTAIAHGGLAALDDSPPIANENLPVEELVSEEPVEADEPISEEPSDDKATGEDSTAGDEPTAEEATAEEPAGDESASEEPADDTPTNEAESQLQVEAAMAADTIELDSEDLAAATAVAASKWRLISAP